MFKLFVRNRRAVAAAVSAMLFASVFTPGGCTINIDEGAVQQLADWASQYEPPWAQPGGFDDGYDGFDPEGGCDGSGPPPQQGGSCQDGEPDE